MFDIGFSELVLVFIVGLVVLGPKRLPIAIRTVMGWVRTIRGLAANVQNELAQELKLQELQESIKKAEALNLSELSPELSKTVADLKQSAEKMQQSLENTKGQIQALTDEQVAEIQQKIEQESQSLSDAQNQAQNPPLAVAESPETAAAQALNDEEAPVLSGEIAELAEADEENLAVYYPPDDDLATVSAPTKDKDNVS